LKLSLGIANRISDINSNVRFIYLSSGAVYGECDHAKKESDFANPTTSYGIAKYAIENQLKSAFPNQLTVMRIGNVFGSDQSFGLMAKLRSVFESRETFNLSGSLETSRDYMSEEYFADAFYSILIERKCFPVINVGSGISLTIAEIINIFERELNYKFRIWVEDVTEDYLLSTKLNISQLNSIFPKLENPEKLISKYAKDTLLI
jgi:nucleoside-diphosphate-sugar epimerase